MNVLRSLARDLWSVLGAERSARGAAQPGAQTLSAVRQARVPSVLGVHRYRDAFEQLPQGVHGALRTLAGERAFRPVSTVRPSPHQRDGFDAAPRLPVDLSGGVAPSVAQAQAEAPVAAPPGNGFTASLDDLAALL